MAIALQDGVLVWQKVKNALVGANPAHQNAFRVLREYLATQGGNPQLQFVPYSAELITTNAGYSPDVDAATLYGVYGKGRRTSGTTKAFFQLFAQADNTASTTLIIYGTRLAVTGQSFAATFPTGIAFETELTVACDTTVAGDTESSAADACDGFVLIGA